MYPCRAHRFKGPAETLGTLYASITGLLGMAFFKITLMRSAIGLPEKTRGVLHALGLRKRMRTVYYPVSPEVAGQVMKVKELVAVSEVDEALTKAEQHQMRKPDPGYYIEKAMPR
ncbi:MAG: 39S ribosomal protein L33, mitochondrial [Sclerophora amabilis]|nr:MAG: 39S ribosomal protein L33, mitochondrial [Sclerophora amabilis]